MPAIRSPFSSSLGSGPGAGARWSCRFLQHHCWQALVHSRGPGGTRMLTAVDGLKCRRVVGAFSYPLRTAATHPFR
jgi:hypothetical protein